MRLCDTYEYTETAKHPGAVGVSKKIKDRFTESDKRMHRLNAPVFFLFYFCFDQHGLSVPDSINEFPNRIRPDQMSHATASDLGIIDCFFFSFLIA